MTDHQFAHLHVHSEYSLLDGAARIEDLARLAAEHGSPALALTDHGNLHGALALISACKKYSLTAIVGIEAYLAPRGMASRGERDEAHVTLLALDEEGYRNLCTLSTAAWRDGFYYKPRVDLDLLAKHERGIVCLSGCLSGTVAAPLVRGDYDAARAAAIAYRDIFGDRFYLEIMRHGLADQEAILAGLRRLGTDLVVPLVATNDCHYACAGDAELHDALLCLGTGKKLADPARMRFDAHEFYLKTPQAMRAVFSDFPDACDATIEIAKRVNLKLTTGKTYHIPSFPIPDGTVSERRLGRKPSDVEYLRALVTGGAKMRYGVRADAPAIVERINSELAIITEMGFSSYFLIVWDFVKYARSKGIPVGPGRGSAVGSIVAYCLGITALDPLEHGLYFERFLNPSRVSMPDIDTDFCIDGRAAVIEYVTQKYGDDRVASIATFATIATKNAVRDAARVLDLPNELADRICKLIPNGPQAPKSLDAAICSIPQLARILDNDERARTIVALASRFEGFTRGTGTHAAAVIIGDAPLTTYLPLYRPKDSAIMSSQYAMNDVESLGLLKMDFLGLRNLTVMRDTCAAVRATADPNFSIDAIPNDDAATFQLIARGDTNGVFQLEGEGMKRAIAMVKPDRFGDIVSLVALYRPGPMDLIPQYCRVKRGEAKPEYLHPALAPILDETYGVMVFQEQVMRVAQDIAGFSLAEADNLRKIMGKKQVDKIAAEREKFVSSAVAHDVNEEIARAIFMYVEPFAGYGFCKSHAVAYAWISYQTAYLKAHYPRQYLAALMSSVADKTEKFIGYARDAAASGISVLCPDVNASQMACTVEDQAIRLGFNIVRHAAESGAQAIIAERDANGAYRNLHDLVDRVRPLGLQKSTLELLIKAGACDSFDGHRTQMIASLNQAFAAADHAIAVEREGRIDLFGSLYVVERKLEAAAPSSRATILAWEYEALGLYLSGDPVDRVRGELASRYGVEIRELAPFERRWVGGAISNLQIRTTRSNKALASFSLADATGSISCLAVGDTVERYRHVLSNGAIVLALGLPQPDSRNDTPDDAELRFFLDELVTAEQIEQQVAS